MIKRGENESLLNYFNRITRNRKELDLSYEQWQELLIGENKYSSENCRKAYYIVILLLEILSEDEKNRIVEGIESEEEKQNLLNEIERAKIELEKERKKKQTINVEFNKLLRESAREELFYESMERAIKERPLYKIAPPLKINHNNKDGILAMSDFHYGREVSIKGLNGEIINEYNNDIFKKRMNDLLSQTIDICLDRGIEHLHIMNLADCIDGILRVSQLRSLQTGVIDSVIEFCEFLAEWLNTLSSYVRIDYYQCWGNHDEIRILTGKKGDFPHENVNKIIMKFLELSLSNNTNVVIHNEDLPYIYFDICGSKVFGYHGEDKNLPKTLKWFEDIYRVNIDYIFGGHLHSQCLETVGMGSYADKQAIRIPSICSIDDYSMNLHSSSRAGANIFIFEEGKGKKSTEDIWLK